jgi:hypothetical protein
MGIADSGIPDWMGRIKAEQDAARDRADADARDRTLLEALMRTEEPRNIWKRLENELERIAGLSGKTIGIGVSVHDVSSSVESILRVSARLPGVGRIGELRSIYSDVFFTPGECRIRCLNQLEHDFSFFDFRAFKNSLTLCAGTKPVTPEEVASDIIEQLVSILRSQRC